MVCAALKKLRMWEEKNGVDTAKLSRKLDCSWELARRIEDGETRPDVDAVLMLQELAGIRLEDWVQ